MMCNMTPNPSTAAERARATRERLTLQREIRETVKVAEAALNKALGLLKRHEALAPDQHPGACYRCIKERDGDRTYYLMENVPENPEHTCNDAIRQAWGVIGPMFEE